MFTLSTRLIPIIVMSQCTSENFASASPQIHPSIYSSVRLFVCPLFRPCFCSVRARVLPFLYYLFYNSPLHRVNSSSSFSFYPVHKFTVILTLYNGRLSRQSLSKDNSKHSLRPVIKSKQKHSDSRKHKGG